MSDSFTDTRGIGIFVDERDAANFILVGYLTGTYSFEAKPGVTPFNQVSQLEPFSELLQLAREILRDIPSTQNGLPFGEADLRRMESFLALAEISPTSFESSGLIYGYLRPPLSESGSDNHWLIAHPDERVKYMHLRVKVCDALLKIGESPLGEDRWGRRFHQILPPTASQWRTIILTWGYPLCNLRYLANIEDDDDDDLLQEDPIITMVDSLLEEPLGNGGFTRETRERSDGLILDEEELYQVLSSQASCHDRYYLATILDYITENYRWELEDSVEGITDPIDPINQTQIQIIINALTRLAQER